jgi:uncharacterized protein (DUF58 family)
VGPPARVSVTHEDLGRATRLLVVRSRREARGLFAGNYVSAFRGAGLEFDESRPYVPGDDVRSIDWNATARHGETFVKLFRAERDQALSFALDVSASMRFGSAGASKAATAAHALALLATAAGHAGDRLGLVAFDREVRALQPLARGVVHGWRIVHTALTVGADARGGTRLVAGLRPLRSQLRRRGVVVVLSDLPEDALREARDDLADLARRHDLVAGIPLDPREIALPRVGVVSLADPERPGEVLRLDTGSRRARRRYLAACAERRRRVTDVLRRAGAEWVWLRTDRNPLYALGRFFHDRAGRRHRAAA